MAAAPNGSPRKPISLDFAVFPELPAKAAVLAGARGPGDLIKAAAPAPASSTAAASPTCAALSQPAFFSVSSPVPVGSPGAGSSPKSKVHAVRGCQGYGRFDPPPAAGTGTGGVAAALTPAAFDACGHAIRSECLGSHFDSHLSASVAGETYRSCILLHTCSQPQSELSCVVHEWLATLPCYRRPHGPIRDGHCLGRASAA